MKKILLLLIVLTSYLKSFSQAPASPARVAGNQVYIDVSSGNVDSTKVAIYFGSPGYAWMTTTKQLTTAINGIYSRTHTYSAVQTYAVSPIVPTATLSGQAVNFGQLTSGYQPIGSSLTLGAPNQVVTQIPQFRNGVTIDSTLNGQNWSINPQSQDFFHMGNTLHNTGVDFETNQGNTSVSIVMNSNDATHPLMGLLYSPAFNGDDGVYEMLDNNQANAKRILTTNDLGTGTLTYSLTNGYGISGSAFNNTANQIWIVDSTSTTGLVSKSRLATNLGGYVKTSSAVTSIFGRIGAVVATSGDYNTSQVTENTNLYFTNARARSAISTTGSLTYNSSTGIMNYPLDTANVISGVNSSKATLRSAVLYTYGSGFFTLPYTASGLPSGINQNSDYISGIFVRHQNLSNNKGLWLFNQIGTNGLYYTSYDGFIASSYKVWDSGNLTSPVNNPMTTLGDGIYGGASGTPTKFAGNTTTTQKFLTQTGTGSAGAAPVYFDLFNTSNSWGGHQTFNGYINMQGNSPILFYNTAGTFYTQLNTNSTTTQNNLISFPNKAGIIALINDNISEFTNDAGYLTSGTGVTGGSITWSGTLYSTPTTGTVSGGTLTFAPALATQAINKVFAGPSSGSSAAPTFRSLVANDLPGTFNAITAPSGTFTGTLTGVNIYGTSATPSVAAQPGAGTGASVSVVGTNSSGIITIITGTSPVASSTLVNLTLAGGFAFPNNATGIAQASPTSSLLPTGVSLVTDSTTTVFQINSSGGALAASTTYKINYIIIGY